MADTLYSIKELGKRMQIKARFALIAQRGPIIKKSEYTIAAALQELCDKALSCIPVVRKN